MVTIMPANLTPQYYEAEARYKKASTPEDKMEALQEMLSIMPKHKGTEKLQADIKKRLAQLREESQQKKKQKGGYNPFHVEKQGAGQVALAGCPNTGKSALVSTLTRAKVKVADFPFTTSIPATGMMPYEDIMIQLVDTPPFTEDGAPPGLIGTFRNADMILLTIDLSSGGCLDQVETSFTLLEERGVIDREGENPVALPFLLLGMKADLPDADANLEVLKELYPQLELTPVSIHQDLTNLQETIFKILDVIRIYGKTPGKKAQLERPFILKSGSTVLDLAYTVHRDFPDKLKSALVWGSARFDGQAVAKDYVLHDKDIVELVIQ
ncbi:GTPase [Dethiobacter alkaliphilus]|uniref:GTPase n=1 Tax=Dethiobacter alkaliphilus TaxID=427926 RepID=UPI00222783D3|nr:GTPase [Dethiobacter alkaliphilus]MCW3489390.1 50S ribosome-binding GTPase [Dethiobacter alkaliphilus]